MMACGPFTQKDNLTFEPLKEFLNVVKRDKPHVVILAGPFLD
jgi:DNA polymerase alpha subunit B